MKLSSLLKLALTKGAIALSALLLGGTILAAPVAKEVTDKAAYPSSSADELGKWFEDIQATPANFDIWHGKKDRLYLHGPWKFRFVDPGLPMQTMADIQASPEYKAKGYYELPKTGDSSLGEELGYYKKGFNDAQWAFLAVPKSWRFQCPKVYNVGWYRRAMDIPEAWRGRRVLATFVRVNDIATVYVNGKKAVSHENTRMSLNPASIWAGNLYGNTEERFTFDITPFVEFGKSNTLAVKVYSQFYEAAGILEEAWLESVPDIYMENALVTPDLGGKRILVKATIVNTTGKKASMSPQAELGPWKSWRYGLASGPVETIRLDEMRLEPGANEVEFAVPVTDPQRWSPERPYLYHLVIRDAVGQVIGQERFGFRAFTVGKRMLELNGREVFLRSEDLFYPGCSGVSYFRHGCGVLNAGRGLERWLDLYRQAGYNFMRFQAGYPNHTLHDLADEMGLMSSSEECYLERHCGVTSLKDGVATLSEKFKRGIRDCAITAFNHPSIVTRSCGNEVWDTYALKLPMWHDTGFGPYLNAIYDEYKRNDPTRPIVHTSGLTPQRSWSPSITKNQKLDFNDIHAYSSGRNFMLMEYPDYQSSYRKIKQDFVKQQGRELPLLNGETFMIYCPLDGLEKRATEKLEIMRRTLGQGLKNGLFDRKWLADGSFDRACESYKWEEGGGAFNHAPWTMVTFNAELDSRESIRQYCWNAKQILEMERRNKGDSTGYVLHSTGLFWQENIELPTDVVRFRPELMKTFQQAQQPVLPCLDRLFNKNLVVGKPSAARLYVINDLERNLADVSVDVSLEALQDGWDVPVLHCKFPAVAGLDSQEVELTAPALPSGHYRLKLEAKENGLVVGSNHYTLFLLNPKDIKLKGKMTPGTCLYAPKADAAGKLEVVLKQLSVNYRPVESFSALTAQDKTLLISPNGYAKGKDDDQALAAWVKGGGKLLMLEQDKIPTLVPWRCTTPGGLMGFCAELVLPSQPAFAGLVQDDFKIWSATGKDPMTMSIVDNPIVPLNEGVLAMLPANKSTGMGVCEGQLGQGRFLFSQLKALDRFGVDSVATRYLLNLLDYAICGFNDAAAPSLDNLRAPSSMAPKQYAADKKKTFFVDLRPYATMGLADEVANDGKGGWTDQGPKLDLHELQAGVADFAGVPFEIVDAARNQGKACVVLGSGQPGLDNLRFLPREVLKIKVNRKAAKLYFLVAAAYTTPKQVLANLRVVKNIDVTTMGTISNSVLPLKEGANIADWLSADGEAPEALPGWACEKPGGGTATLYVVEWSNPEPGVEISYVDFASTGAAVPILLGITGVEN